MKTRYILLLSLKNLIGHKMRTFLTAGGVAISVGFVVFLVSLGLGLQRISTNQIANLDALRNLTVTSGNSKIVKINDDTIKKFSTLTNVIDVQPTFSNPARISYNGSNIDGVAYAKSTEYIKLESPKYDANGGYTSDNSNDAILSSDLLTQFGVKDMHALIGKEISLETTMKSSDMGTDGDAKKLDYKLKVVAVVDDANAPYIYMPINLLTRDGLVNYSGALVRVSDKSDIDKVKTEVENLGYKTSSVKETVDQINQFFSVFQVILLSFGAISIIVACLGVFNTLTISLLEKTREVGFMKAMGATRSDIYKLFISESIIIGILGSAVGLTVGFAIGNILNLSIAGLAKATGNVAVELFYTPLYLIVVIVVIALLISFLTGLYPSYRAAKINPLDALRYE